MAHSVHFVADARADVEGIYRYIATTDCRANADKVLDKLLQAVDSLENNPSRGLWVPELAELQPRQYRQLTIYSYRMIYQVIENNVYILLVADGRRDMAVLLRQRLL